MILLDEEVTWGCFEGYDEESERLEKVVKATGKKILIQLQAIYNIPDLGAEDVRMGEFIQELMEEVNG